MSSHATYTSRYLPPVFNIYGCMTALVLVCASALAWGQQAPPLKLTNVSPTTNTPEEIRNGVAQLVEPYNPSSKLRLAISLKAPKAAEEEQLIKQLQDKTSPNYRKYLTPEQFNARFAPAAEDEQAVVDWANSQGLTVTARYPNRMMVNVEGSVDAIQKAFNVHINRYAVNGTTEFSNDRDPLLPSNLVEIVQFVDGLNSIVRMHPVNRSMKGMRGPDYAPGPMHQIAKGMQIDADTSAVEALKMSNGKQSGGQATNGFYDPTDFWSQEGYDWDALQAQGHCCNPTHNSGQTPPQTSIALATDGDFLDSDFLGFHNQYSYLAGHYGRIYVDGTPSCCDDETTLDLEWSTAMSNSRGSYVDTSLIWVYEAAEGFGDFGTVYQQMVTDNLVRVVNISYGLSETVFLDDAPGLLTSWHNTFNQMIIQGWTIMASSGDSGSDAGCTGALGVLYPESDPDVTSVGGTRLELNADGTFNTEVAWTGDTFSGACSGNDGGGGGGCSAVWSAPGYQTAGSPYCGTGRRSVPDIALHASPHPYTNFYFEGSLDGVAGTSLASPMMSGFIAQENAYSLSMGNACDGTHNCAPIGEVNWDIYAEGGYNHSAPHYPFYDITSGCTTNDTISVGWCAASGYDLATGWGSFNALQMAWAINWEDNLAYSAPSVVYSGPATNTWYNSDQEVSWTINANSNPTGIAGFSQGWDSIPADPFFDGNRNDSNSFFSGPEFPNATTGCLSLNGGFGCAGGVSQGCHTAHVRSWSNQGSSSGDTTYGPICYDDIAPSTTASLNGTLNGGIYDTAVKVTLSATDATSGVAHTYYSVDGSGYAAYSGAFTISSLGTHTVRFYSVDNANNVESLKVASFTIYSLTSTTLSSSLNPSRYLQNITLTAKVAAALTGTPTGTVTFKFGTTTLGTGTLSGGVATLTTNTLPEGTADSLTASYGGATDFFASTSSVYTQRVLQGQTTTTLTSSVNPSKFGQSTTLTATIVAEHGGTPTGTVTFKKGSTTIGTAALSGGKAILAVSNLPVGVSSITAAYGGSGDYLTSTSSALSQTVNKASTTITVVSSANPSAYNQPVTFTVTVSPAYAGSPTGIVTLLKNGSSIGTATLSSGKATFTMPFVVGGWEISASYGGNADFTSSASTAFNQKTNAASTTTTLASSKNPSQYGLTVTFTATVTPAHGGTVSGTVTFKQGTTVLGTSTVASGKAQLAVSSLGEGTFPITAVYDGSTDFLTSTSATLSQVINKASTTTKVTSSLNPAVAGAKVTFTATVTAASGSTPTGSVTFLDGATTLGTGTLNSSGTAIFSTTKLNKGTHSITAPYGGSALDLTSTSSALSQVIN